MDDDDWRGTGTKAKTLPSTTTTPNPGAATVGKPVELNQNKGKDVPEKQPAPQVVKVEDKWDGEDENADNDNVKDNWDDEDEEITAPPTETALAKSTDGVKAIQIKSKKGKNKKQFEKLKIYDEYEPTPAEIENNKIREEKAREAEELRLTKEAFGIAVDKNEALDIINPITKDDFDGLRKKIVEDLAKFSARSPYHDFLEDLIVDLSVCLPSKRLKKVKTSIEVLYFEKSKSEKTKGGQPGANTGGGKSASSKGIKLNVEGDRAILKQRDVDDYDEFDDFM